MVTDLIEPEVAEAMHAAGWLFASDQSGIVWAVDPKDKTTYTPGIGARVFSKREGARAEQ